MYKNCVHGTYQEVFVLKDTFCCKSFSKFYNITGNYNHVFYFESILHLRYILQSSQGLFSVTKDFFVITRNAKRVTIKWELTNNILWYLYNFKFFEILFLKLFLNVVGASENDPEKCKTSISFIIFTGSQKL